MLVSSKRRDHTVVCFASVEDVFASELRRVEQTHARGIGYALQSRLMTSKSCMHAVNVNNGTALPRHNVRHEAGPRGQLEEVRAYPAVVCAVPRVPFGLLSRTTEKKKRATLDRGTAWRCNRASIELQSSLSIPRQRSRSVARTAIDVPFQRIN